MKLNCLNTVTSFYVKLQKKHDTCEDVKSLIRKWDLQAAFATAGF